jgi:hypothetical protein
MNLCTEINIFEYRKPALTLGTDSRPFKHLCGDWQPSMSISLGTDSPPLKHPWGPSRVSCPIGLSPALTKGVTIPVRWIYVLKLIYLNTTPSVLLFLLFKMISITITITFHTYRLPLAKRSFRTDSPPLKHPWGPSRPYETYTLGDWQSTSSRTDNTIAQINTWYGTSVLTLECLLVFDCLSSFDSSLFLFVYQILSCLSGLLSSDSSHIDIFADFFIL